MKLAMLSISFADTSDIINKQHYNCSKKPEI